jgi:peroxiredoxin
VRSLSLPFVVLSDPNLEAIDLYGVRVEKGGIREDQGGSRLNEMYVRYVKRLENYAAPSVFIIDGQHLLGYKFLSRDAPTDFPENEEVLARLREIS